MPDKRRLVSRPDTGPLAELGVQVRLIWRLLGDARVNLLLKLLPVGSFIYLLFPFDVLGPIDDALVLWLGGTLFIELSPPDVVEEYRAQLEAVHKAEEPTSTRLNDEDIIDATYRTDT